ELLHADGTEEILLEVPRYDFNWQHRYVLATPRRIRAGSKFRCSAVFDNSAENPANPDPNVEARAGMQSWDEMFNGYFDVALADEDLTAPVPWYRAAWTMLREAGRPGVSLILCVVCGLYLSRRRIGRALRPAPE